MALAGGTLVRPRLRGANWSCSDFGVESQIIETEFGPIPLKGRFGSDGPVLLLIRGAFADPEMLGHLPDHLPAGWSGVAANLPGSFGGPPLRAVSVDVFAQGFSAVVRTALTNRKVVVLGLSVGGLVAMAMRAAEIRRLILVDPPLSTGKAWALKHRILPILRTLGPDDPGRQFASSVLGVAEDRLEDRSYYHLLRNLDVPADLMLGDVPLAPPRTLDNLPCLNDAEDIARYRSHPMVSCHIMEGAGHNIPAQAPLPFLRIVHDACARAGDDSAATARQNRSP